ARGLRGQRVRLSGWFKGDSLKGMAFVKIYAQGIKTHVTQSPGAELLSETWDWRQIAIELDIPEDAAIVWADLQAAAPAKGTVWIDDASLEGVGRATGISTMTAPAANKKDAGPGSKK